MIRSCSEAICETIGSSMNQHGGKNCYLQPKYFNNEMFLRVNLGPMHLLKDFVNDVFVSDPKDYIRKENRISKITSQDINKSSATFQKNNEKKSRFPNSCWESSSSKWLQIVCCKNSQAMYYLSELKFWNAISYKNLKRCIWILGPLTCMHRKKKSRKSKVFSEKFFFLIWTISEKFFAPGKINTPEQMKSSP